MYECPVPKEICSGRQMQIEPGCRTGKVHIHQDEVKKCLAKYLGTLGYKSLGNRSFALGDGPILVLSKKSGMRLRKGKGKGKGSQDATRMQAVNLRKAIKVW